MLNVADIYDGATAYDDPWTTYDGWTIPATPADWICDLRPFYQLGEFAVECYVVPAAEGADQFGFDGILSTVDTDDFGAPTVTTHALRYPIGPDIRAGDSVYIDQRQYSVAGLPALINACERRAYLVRQA